MVQFGWVLHEESTNSITTTSYAYVHWKSVLSSYIYIIRRVTHRRAAKLIYHHDAWWQKYIFSCSCIRIKIQLTLLSECGVTIDRTRSIISSNLAVSVAPFPGPAQLPSQPARACALRRLILDLGERHARDSQTFSRLLSSHSQDRNSHLIMRK